MKKIGLICDEGADLTEEIVKKEQIAIVAFQVDLQDLKELPGGNIYQKMREAQKRKIRAFIKTSQPSPKAFIDTFLKQFQKFENLICITISSKLSGTFNSACQAKNFLEKKLQEKIEIIDSLNGSAGETLLALKAIKLIKEGRSFSEIIKKLREYVPKIKLIGMLKDPARLEASGRIPSFLANWIRGMQKLGIRPLLGVRKGKIIPIGIRKGAKDIPEALFKEFLVKTKKLREIGVKIEIVITHADDFKGAQKLKEKIESQFENIKIVLINIINEVVGGLVGPGTIILAWAFEEEFKN